jgi:acyl-CoA synthetase (AMP-forming)/AMP-acid ligase II
MSDLFSRLCDFPSDIAGDPALLMIDGRTVSFAQLTQTVITFAGHAAQAGIGPGDRIAIEIPNGAIRLCLILALLRVGAIAVAGATADDFRKAGVTLAGVITQRLDQRTTPRHIALNQTWFEPIEPEPRGASAPTPDPAEPRLLMSSSGSTGEKKFMDFTFAMLEQRLEWDRTVFGDERHNRLVTLGLGTDFGLRQALLTLQHGGLLVRAGASPAATIELIRTHRIHELVTTPFMLNDLVKSTESTPVPVPELKSIITVGGPISGQLARRAAHLFGAAVTNVYGSTETGLIAVAKGTEWFATEGASGTVMPWIDLEIIDETDEPQPPGTIGEVRVRLDRRFSIGSYLNPGDSEEEPIRAGWFYPGDIGSLSTTRELTIAGRARELINLGGTKISPAAIEDRLRQIRGIEQLAAVGLRNSAGYDDVGLAICRSPDVTLATIDEAIRMKLDRGTRIRMLEVKVLPLTETGKVDRMQLKTVLEGQR